MPHYVILVNFTDQGARNIRDLASMLGTNDRVAASLGVKLTRYFTLGTYDIVVIAEAPNDEAMAKGVLGVVSRGNAKTTTLKAFTEKEFLAVVKGVPDPNAAAPSAPRRVRARR